MVKFGDALRALRQGSHFLAGVHEDYHIEHGVLHSVGRTVRDYFPFSQPGVTTDLAKLHEGDERGLLSFARTWGLLGYTPPPERQHDPSAWPKGDPVRWVWAHSRAVHLVLELHSYLQSGDYDGLDRFLDSYVGPNRSFPVEAFTVTVATPHGVGEWSKVWGGDVTPARAALDVIKGIVNPNLKEVSYTLADDLEVEGALRPILDYPSLAVVAYWHLSNAMSSIRPVRRCHECGEFFVVTDRRQQFCPPAPHQKGTTGSLCGARYRKRGKGGKK